MLTLTDVLEFEKIILKSNPQDWIIENLKDEDGFYTKTSLSYKDKLKISYKDKNYTWYHKNFVEENKSPFTVTLGEEDFYADLTPDNDFLNYRYDTYSDSNEKIWEFRLDSENYDLIFTIHLATLINQILIPKLKEHTK